MPSRTLTARCSAQSGRYQRTAGTHVRGGQFLIGDPTGQGGQLDYVTPGIDIVRAAAPIGVGEDATLPSGLTAQFAAQPLFDHGFTGLTIFSNDHVALTAGTPLTLPEGGALAFNAPRVDLDASITALGGSIAATAPTATAA